MEGWSDPLSAKDLRALREADRVLFRWYFGRTQDEPEQVSGIRASKTIEGDPWKNEVTYEVPVPSQLHQYGEHIDRPSASAWIGSAQYHPEWQTIARAILKVGYRLSLLWLRGNNTPALKKAGMVTDELALRVLRGDDPRDDGALHKCLDVLTFRIDSQTGPDNTARMIRDGRF